MNIFGISPGRTGTTALAEALECVDGYTSTHEALVKELGPARVDYPENHIEFDNRLVWFLPRLTEKYGASSVLVVVKRDAEKIAASYNRRWYKVNMMTAYCQGILLRENETANLEVCRDFVSNVYEHLEAFSPQWAHVVELDLESPREGVEQLLRILDREGDADRVLGALGRNVRNENHLDLRDRASIAKHAFVHLRHQLAACLHS